MVRMMRRRYAGLQAARGVWVQLVQLVQLVPLLTRGVGPSQGFEDLANSSAKVLSLGLGLGLDSLGALWPQWPLIPLDSGPGALESPEGETTS